MNILSKSVAGQSFPLTSLQQGMLFQSLLSTTDDRGVDVEQLVIRVRQRLEPAALAAAFKLMIERYPSLGASFHAATTGSSWQAGQRQPFQVFHQDLNVEVTLTALGLTGPGTEEDDLRTFLDADRRRGFDLAEPPLMRAKIAHCTNSTSYLVWTFHHILLDGRSIAQFIFELFEAYEAISHDQPLSLGPRPRSYVDYLKYCGARDHREGIEYFKQLLSGKSTPTPVPLVEPEGRNRAGAGSGEVELVCDPALVRAVRKVAESTGTTVSTVVQAAYALVLSRHTGDDDVVFGTTRAGRAGFGPTAKDMMGLFTNSLPVRAFVVGHCTVEQLLHSLREQSLKARRFETTPLSEIFRASDVPAGMPVFETLVMYENRSLGDTLKELGGEKWADRQVHLHERPSFPLTLIVYDGSEFTMRMLYDRRRLSEKAVQRLLASCKQALTEFALNSNRTLAEIDVLPVLERRKILVEWNHTAAPFSDELCIHQLFEASVDIEPTAPAVEVNGRVLSYRELEERANQVAHLLISRGVEPGTYVGICLRRGFDLIIAMLGILKAGAAYLPLDPEYPADRLQFMLKDVSAALVITQEGIAPGLDYARVVVDGADTQAIAQCPVDRPPLGVDSASKCYTIFTSGSTGQPKGVVLTHRAVINTLEWVNRTFDVAPSDRLLFVTSPCFDLSVYDIFGVLGRGGTVVVATEELLSQPEALAEFIVDAKITIWDSAPAALQRLVPFIAKKGGFDLRLCMLSGDWIPLPLPDAVRAVFPYCRVISLGGATEAAIWSNWFPIEQLDERWTSIPYGRPIQNSRYFVLDSRLQPVPVGVSGDLYISGVCLASGYHARPELTAERFITVPFPEASGQICYKTGDLARYFEDGNLEFLGRSDFQVKIRGFRVEMGEVEAVLSQFEGVEVAVCVALPDASGQKSLIAYVVPKKGQVLDEEVIKVSVGAKLPVFMVPSRIVFLDALPTTRNGKLDRAALPDPHLRVVDDKLVPPQGAVEEELVRMWSDLLQRDQISVTDHFFEVGGHSLLAVMLVARIKDRFHHDLPLATLLGSPTIRKLAPHIERATGVQAASKHLQVFHQDGVLPPLVLVPGVVGTAFTYRSLPDALGPYQPIYVVDLLAAGGVSEFPDTIEGMADLYEPEILEACAGRPIVLGGFSFGAIVAFELARRLREKGHLVPLLISFDGFAPGYPYRLPWPERLLSHTREFLSRDRAGRIQYVSEREKKFRKKLLGRFKLADDPDVPELKHEFQAHMDKISAAQRRAQLSYSPQGVEKDLALLLVRAEETPYWSGMKMDDPLHGWRRFLGGPISLITFPGTHMEIWDEGNRVLVTQAIVEHLARFLGRPRSERWFARIAT